MGEVLAFACSALLKMKFSLLELGDEQLVLLLELCVFGHKLGDRGL